MRAPCVDASIDRDQRHLHPRGDETHVNPPQQSHKIEEHDPLLHRHAAEADDGRERPDLVPGHNDGDRLVPHVGSDLVRGLPLHDAHQQEERDRVEDGAERDAVDEPLGHGVAQVQLGLPLRRVLAARVLLLDVAGGRCFPFVRGEGALEQLLPHVVRRGRDEGHGNKTEEVRDVEREGPAVAVGFEELGENVGCAG